MSAPDDPLHPDDAAVLDKLAVSSDLERPRQQTHFLFFTTRQGAVEALAQAESHGWEPHGEIRRANGVTRDSQPPTHPWTVTVRRSDLPTTRESLPGTRAFLEDLCLTRDGLYDGWEAVTDEQLDDVITMAELSDEEIQFLVKLRELAKKINIADDLDAIQELFAEQRATWHTARPKKRFDEGAIVHALGVACGDILAGELDLRWVRLTDHHGTDFALVSAWGDASGLTFFPINAVSSRWQNPAKPGLDVYVAEVLNWARELR